ncbi:MAG TPA: PKD domain-containing protein [Candidatus Limnocylindria bacterium]|nr:PKD domain-containing protein [Candidatus Limnocylindria bacterium]
MLVLLAPDAGARRAPERLLRILTPAPRSTAAAHPHVNVVVEFVPTAGGTVPDATTFRARLNGVDVTDRFTPLAPDEIAGVSGVRAALEQDVLRVGANNKLRLRVRAAATAGKPPRRAKGRARVRFTAEPRENQAPVARAEADSELVVAGLPIRFDASASSDPELDPLTFTWDFGDGATAAGAIVEHTWASAADEAHVTVTVSDGAASAVRTIVLAAEPPVGPGRTKGVLAITADGPLEFGSVPPGETALRTVTVENADATSTSQLIVRMQSSSDAFTVDPPSLDLGPSGSGTLTIRFAPTDAGHAEAVLTLLASATNRAAVSLLAHGFGGAAPGSGPTLAARPAYYVAPRDDPPGAGVHAIQPDGTRLFAHNTVSACTAPGGGTGDACLVDADCAVAGETCDTSETILFDPQDLCADPEGNVIVLGGDGTVTDPDPNALTERSAAVLRVSLDAGGAPLGKAMLTRVTGDTTQIACDERSRAEGGRAYVAEYFDVENDRCLRTEREALTAIRKDTGRSDVLRARLDSIQGIDDCNDLEDAATALAVAGAGDSLFVGFDLGGIWRYDPRAGHRAYVTGLVAPSALGVHPDGALVFAVANPSGTRTVVHLYKVSAARVAGGPLAFAGMTPCASHTLPSNGGSLFIGSLAVGPAASDPEAAVALVALQASTEVQAGVLPPALAPQGTIAFTLPPGPADTCSAASLVTVDTLDLLSF